MRSVSRTLAAMVFAVGCSSPTISSTSSQTSPPPPPPPPPAAIRVLMITTTAAFRHDSIPTARQVMTTMAAQSGEFTVSSTEDLSTLTTARLAEVNVLMFALTSGELPLDPSQKNAIVSFVDDGGGFIGVHSASDTLYEWSDYGRLVGAYFKEHPWTEEATVSVEDRAHPISAGLGAGFRLTEEYYTFRVNPRTSVHVLLSLDPPSVRAQGDFPLAWTQTIGRGRSYYNALGHFPQTWNDSRFQTMMRNAIQWVAGRTG